MWTEREKRLIVMRVEDLFTRNPNATSKDVRKMCENLSTEMEGRAPGAIRNILMIITEDKYGVSQEIIDAYIATRKTVSKVEKIPNGYGGYFTRGGYTYEEDATIFFYYLAVMKFLEENFEATNNTGVIARKITSISLPGTGVNRSDDAIYSRFDAQAKCENDKMVETMKRLENDKSFSDINLLEKYPIVYPENFSLTPKVAAEIDYGSITMPVIRDDNNPELKVELISRILIMSNNELLKLEEIMNKRLVNA